MMFWVYDGSWWIGSVKEEEVAKLADLHSNMIYFEAELVVE